MPAWLWPHYRQLYNHAMLYSGFSAQTCPARTTHLLNLVPMRVRYAQANPRASSSWLLPAEEPSTVLGAHETPSSQGDWDASNGPRLGAWIPYCWQELVFCTVTMYLGTCSQNKTKRFCNFTWLLTPPVTLFTDIILKQTQTERY